MATQEEYHAELEVARTAALKQLDYFAKGMRWSMNGVDRSDLHVASLTKMVGYYDKLLGNGDA